MASRRSKRNPNMNVHEIGSLNLDVFAVADHFGGRKPLYDAIVYDGGYDHLMRFTMDKWFDRRRIPLHWLLTIIEVAEAIENPIDPYAYAVPPEFERIHECTLAQREAYLNKFGRTLGVTE